MPGLCRARTRCAPLIEQQLAGLAVVR
jgi:hypothetical protein